MAIREPAMVMTSLAVRMERQAKHGMVMASRYVAGMAEKRASPGRFGFCSPGLQRRWPDAMVLVFKTAGGKVRNAVQRCNSTLAGLSRGTAAAL